MEDQIYHELQQLLDSIPNGFPKTGKGIEIKILKKIFTPEDAKVALQLRLTPETLEQIADRTGMSRDYLSVQLKEMVRRGQIFLLKLDGMTFYRLLPWAVGVFEFQLGRMDSELAALADEYFRSIDVREMFEVKPTIMRTIPIETAVSGQSEIASYESVRHMVEQARSFAVGDCICRKKARLLGKGCDKPMETCLRIAPFDNIFVDMLKELSPDNNYIGRVISKEEALNIIDMTESAGLVHVVENYKEGILNICNCCSCCCVPLQAIHRWGIDSGSLAKSNYVAVVDEELCTSCETCIERCQVEAISVDDYAKINERCIGCGLCVSTCPTEAIRLIKRSSDEMADIPEYEIDRFEKRAAARDKLEDYKKLL